MVYLSYITWNRQRLQSDKRSSSFISSSLQRENTNSEKGEKHVYYRLDLIGANKRNNQWFGRRLLNQENFQTNTRNQLMVLTKLSIPKCGRKREIIYLGGIDLLFLFIEKNRLASREARKVRCNEKKGTCLISHLKDKGSIPFVCFFEFMKLLKKIDVVN